MPNAALQTMLVLAFSYFVYIILNYLQASYIPRAFSKSHVVCTATFCYQQLYLQAIAILSSCVRLLSLR